MTDKTPIKVTTGKDLPKEVPEFEAAKTTAVKTPTQEKPEDVGPSAEELAEQEAAIKKQAEDFEAKKKALADEEQKLLDAHKARIAKLTEQNEKEVAAHHDNHAERIEALRSASEDELESLSVRLEAEKNARVSNPKGAPIPVAETTSHVRSINDIADGYNGKADTIRERSEG